MMAWPPVAKGQSVPGAGVAALRIFLLSLVAPFVAVVLAYLLLRSKVEPWPPEGAPGFPQLLWFSTLLILLVSATSQLALKGVRKDSEPQLRWSMVSATVLAIGFFSTQIIAWSDLWSLHESTEPRLRLFSNTFFILTGFHALHVILGVGLSIWVTVRSFQRRYWSYHHPGVRYHAMVWHFLDGLWIFLFVVLWFGNSK